MLFDTETTGLIKFGQHIDRMPEVIEFYGAVYDLKSGKKTADYYTLIKPRLGPIPPETTHVHKITDADVAKAPTFDEVSTEIRLIIEKSKVVIAHNLSFDRQMIDLEFERLDRKVKWPRGLCTIEQTMQIKGHRLSMSALHEHLFGEKFSGAHRADVDVAALARCATALFKQGALA